MVDPKRRGAKALQNLLRALADKGDLDIQDCMDDPAAPDARDYRAMAAMVQQSIDDNLHDQSLAHREGYLLALTDLLSITAEGCVPGDDWDPLRDTEPAFAAPALASAAISRMRSAPAA
jgi:hypothetical protein